MKRFPGSFLQQILTAWVLIRISVLKSKRKVKFIKPGGLMNKVSFVFIFILSLLCACQSKPREISLVYSEGLTETRLGASGYMVKHPGAMQLSRGEFHSANEDVSFGFCEKDSLPPFCNSFIIGLKVPDSVHTLGSDL